MLQKTVEAYRNGVPVGTTRLRCREGAGGEREGDRMRSWQKSPVEHNTGGAGPYAVRRPLLCLGLLLLCAVRKQSNGRARGCGGLGHAS